MAIGWTTQRPTVEKLIEEHPAASNACDALARKLLPVAKEIDAHAQTRRVRVSARFAAGVGRLGPCLVPKVSVGGPGSAPWRKHWTTSVVAHCLDALTGAEGTEVDRYFETHWQYPEVLELLAEDLPTEEACNE